MMIIEVPLPNPLSVIFSPSHITNNVPAVRTITVDIPEISLISRNQCHRVSWHFIQVSHISRCLKHGNSYCEITCPLVDLLSSAITFFLQFLHLRNQDGHQLHKDRSRDIWHDTQCKNDACEKAPPANVSIKTKNTVLVALARCIKFIRINTWQNNMCTETVYRIRMQCHKDLTSQLLDAPDILQCL